MLFLRGIKIGNFLMFMIFKNKYSGRFFPGKDLNTRIMKSLGNLRVILL